jgi:hypothetical protein
MKVWVLTNKEKNKFVSYSKECGESLFEWLRSDQIPQRLPLMFPNKITAKNYKKTYNIPALAKTIELGGVTPELEVQIARVLTGLEG